MGWKTIVIGSECKVSLSANRMRITIGEEYHNYPLADLDTVIFSNNKVTITIPIIAKLMENNIGIIICDSRNDPIGIFQPFNCHSLVFKQLKKQINWKNTKKKRFWKFIVEEKIASEISNLRLLKLSSEVIETLKVYKESVYNDDQTNREGSSARIYFKELFGPEFTRDEQIAINFALNYGYKIIASYISKMIAARGYITQLGIHHIGESNPFNLTYDFIEPLRYIVDMWVYENIEDDFNTSHKIEILQILECRIKINNKWMRLTDAIEDLIDSYFAFMNEERDSIIRIDYESGIRSNR
jgi:CRISPR-associated protein Cas1